MKTKLYNLIAWTACIMMASCTNQEIIEEVTKPVHSNTLNVMTEKQESRSVLSYEGTFYWTENDYIGVYGEETENARFHFTSQADGVSVFTGNMNASGETVKWAYFPYSEEVDVDEKQLSFPMPAERTISNENHSPMIGRIEANNTVRFYHTGGILLLKIVGLPKQASQLVITSEGENSPCLAGTAVIDDTNVDGCTYRIENGSKEVVYDVRNLEGDGYVYSIYMPLQVGTYEKIKVTLKNEVGGVIKERSLSNLVVTRGKMTETPTLNFSEKMYAYEIVNDETLTPDWEKALLFSNDFFMAYRSTFSEGHEYIFIDTFTFDIYRVVFDKEDKIIEIDVNDDIYYLYNYTENTFDLKILWNYAEYKEIKGIQRKDNNNQARSMGFTNDHLERTKNAFLVNPNEFLLEESIDANKKISEKAKEAIWSSLDDDFEIDPLHPAGVYGEVIDISKKNLDILISAHTVQYLNLRKAIDYRGATAITSKPQLLSDGQYISVGYVVIGIDDNIHNGNGLERGLMIAEIDDKNVKDLNYSSTAKILQEEVPYEVSLQNGSYTTVCKGTPGKTYAIQAYLKRIEGYTIQRGNIELITIPACYFEEIEVEPCNFSNGNYNFKIKTLGYNYDNSYNCFSKLYKNSKLLKSSKWYSGFAYFDISLNAKEMNYNSKQAIGNWQIGCTIDGVNIPYEFKTVTLKYDRNPSIDLDVQIIDGPRKVGGSRAADDEEEKYYIKYKVTAKTEGSGWIKQVNIKVDGRSVKTGNPKNEGESFTYIGSKTYKNKSELPTISCEGILINGAGNIQSSPGSISVASQVP